jgi:RHS repeat-associated protein
VLLLLLAGLAVAASADASGDYPSTVLSDNPSAYWRLGESSGTAFADSSGNGNTLTLSPPASPSGVPGTYDAAGDVSPDDGAYQFNFDDSNLRNYPPNYFDWDTNGLSLAPRMQATMSSGYPSGTNSYTFEAWVKPTGESSSAPSFPQEIIGNLWGNGTCGSGQPLDAGTRLYFLEAQGNTQGVFVFERGPSGCPSTFTLPTQTYSVPVASGQWYYVVGTFDGQTMRLYIDGTLVTQQPSAGFSIGNSSDDQTINIGGGRSVLRYDTSDDHFKGVIDEAGVYGYALSGSQVQAHYAGGLSTDNSYSNPPPVPPPVASPTLPSVPADDSDCSGATFEPQQWVPYEVSIPNARYYEDEGYLLQVEAANTSNPLGSFVSMGIGATDNSGVGAELLDSNRNYGWQTLGSDLIGPSLRYALTQNVCLHALFATSPIDVVFRWFFVPPLAQENGCDANLDGANDAAFFGDVNSLTGAYATNTTDVKMSGLGVPLTFSRCYSSAFANASGPLGPGWKDSFSANLSVDNAGNALFTNEAGQQILFLKNPDGSFTAPAASSTLTQLGDGNYRLTRVNQSSYLFDSSGQPLSEADLRGEGVTFHYTSGQLMSVTDQTGRSATLSYTGNLLHTVTYSDGRHVSFDYTGGLLTTFTDVRGKLWHYAYDSGNRLASIQDPLGHYAIRNTYDSATGRVTNQQDADGNPRTISFGSGGATTLTDPANKTLTDTYQNNELVSRTDPLGHKSTYTYDTQGNRLTSTDPDGNTTTYTYDANGNMLSEAAPASLGYQPQTWTYNSKNEVTSHRDARGNETDYRYDSAGNLISVVKPGNLTTTYNRNPSNPELVDSVVDARGKTSHYGYDANGNLASVTDPDGNETSYTYDDAGDRLTVISPRGNVPGCGCATQYKTTYSYDEAGHKRSVTDPLGNETTYFYDDAGNLASMVDPLGNAAGGNPSAHTTTYAYDNANELTDVTRPGSAPIHTEYDSRGLVRSRTSSLGRKTTYFYDDAGRLTSVVSPNGNVSGCNCAGQYTTSYSYDAAGNRIKTVNASGGETDYTYDPLNRLVQKTVVGSSTKTTGYSYDPNGNVTETVDPMGRTTFDAYDANNQLTRATRDAATVPAFVGYNNNAAHATSVSLGVAPVHTGPLAGPYTPVPVQNGDLLIAALTLDNTNLVAVPSGWTVQLDWTNGSGAQLVVATHYVQSGDPTSVSFGWATTGYAAIALVDYRGTSQATPVFDVNAVQSGSTTPTGQSTRTDNEVVLPIYAFPGNHPSGTPPAGTTNRDASTSGSNGVDIDSVTQPLAGSVPQYTVTAANIAGIASISSLPPGSEPGTTTAYSYDPNGNVLSVTDANGGVTTYFYDDADLLTSSVSPLGNVDGCGCASQYTTNYGYDEDGNRHTVTDSANRLTTTNYNADEQRLNVTDPAGRETQWQYDANGNLTAVIANDMATTKYAYNALNQRTSKTTGLASPNAGGGNTTNYYPDADGMVTRVVDPLGGTTTYTYDANGNRLTSEDAMANAANNPSLGTTSYTYNALNEPTLISYSDGTHSIGYGYDAQGNLTSRTDASGTTTYGLNLDNQVTSATNGSSSFAYGYDTLGRLTAETYPNGSQVSYGYDDNDNLKSMSSAGKTTSYVYDLNNQLTSENQPNGYTQTNAYDNSGVLTSVTNARAGTTLSSYAVTAQYNDGAPRTLTAQNDGSSWFENYTYDQDGRLASVCYQASCPSGNDPKISWVYDPSGNRVSETRANSVSTAYTYNAADELAKAVKTTGPVPANPYPSSVQTDGAQPYFRLGETSGSSFNSTVGSFPGSWTSSPTLGVNGAVAGDSNGAVTLNGTSQYGSVPNSSGLGKTSSFSVELWVKPSKTGVAQPLAGKPLSTTTSGENYALWLDSSNRPRFDAGTGSKSTSLTASSGAGSGPTSSSVTLSSSANWDAAEMLLKATAGQQPAQVQAAKGSFNAASGTLTLQAAPASGHVLVLAVAGAASKTVSSVVETGVTWTRKLRSNHYGDADVWVGTVGTNASAAIKVTMSASSAFAVATAEFSGVTTTADGSGATANGSSASPASPAVTPSAADLAVSVQAWQSAATINSGPTNGYSLSGSQASGTTDSVALSWAQARLGGTLGPGWHQIVGTFSSGAMKIYVDGAPAGSVTASFTSAATNTGTFNIGRNSVGTAAYYGGSLDDLSVYSTALSATQVQTHYAQATTTPTAPQTTTNYTYNADGEEKNAGSTSYGWNLAGELTSATVGGITTSYGYDGAGMRTSAVTSGSAINYTWDEALGGLATLASETDGSGTPLRTYLYGSSSSPTAMITPGGSYYDSYDSSGNVTDLTDASGGTQRTYSYEPFGNLRSSTNVSGNAPANPYQYAGQYTDAGTGLSDMRARNYDPNTGAFISADPAGQSTTLASSPYAYAGDSPLIYSDPSGLCFFGLLGSHSCGYYIGEGVSDVVGGVSAAAGGVSSAATAFYNTASSAASSAYHYAASAASTAYSYASTAYNYGSTATNYLNAAVNDFVVRPTIQAVQNDVGCLTSAVNGSFSAGQCIEGAIGTALTLLPEGRLAGALADIGGLVVRAALRAAGTDLGESVTSSLFRLATEETGSLDLSAVFDRGAAEGIADDALVVRGGASQALSPEGLAARIGTHPSGVTGWSAESRSGACLEELCRYIPNNQVGVTTAAEIRAAGGDVVETSGRSPNHVTITGISPGDLSNVFGSPVTNPVPLELRIR